MISRFVTSAYCCVRSLLLTAVLYCAYPAVAFPPYKSTDAETAGTHAIEFRLGLLNIEKTGSDSERQSPLTNLNFGIGPHFEISSELEYLPDGDELGDATVGFKWAAPRREGLSIGVETLALLPVQSDQHGAGIESQFLVTFGPEQWQVHGNAGFFRDPRGDETERGWRGSILAEFPRDRLRPGVELFVRDSNAVGTQMQLGVGLIASLERVEIRTGLHLGLNDATPDVEGNVWLSWKWQRGEPAR
jgi:hypothetical protein